MSRALGRYELVRPLARGGMGEVYLARRRAAGVEKWLVVKRMRPERVGDARFLELFRREAKLSMSLAHQNIVPVFDFGRIDDQVFLAMERVEGKDLGSTLSRAGKPLPTLLAAFIAAECLQALDYAHRRKGPDGADLGIVHRDVTPRNVLLSWSGEVKLTDFGIAALAGDDPSHSKMAGTPAYMAPEQARAEALDPRADVYAVGMVLREAITGERPRRGGDRDATIAAARLGTVDPWPEGFESPLKGIVDKATASAKEERFADARSMLAALDELMVDERAAKKGESPARLLAAWLAEVWQGEREEQEKFDDKIEAGELMSFLDDGGIDAAGTGTQRSLLATAADQTPPVGVKVIADAPKVVEKVAPQPVEARSKRSPLMLLALGGVVAIIAIVVATRWPRHEEPLQRLDNPIVAAPASDAASQPMIPVEQPPIDAGVTADAGGPVDAKPAGGVKTPKTPKTPLEKQPGENPPVVAGPKHKVTIQTSPQWSSFTIDGGATKYQTPDTVELAPGTHTIHFTGNEYFPADKTISVEVTDKDLMKAVKLDEAPEGK